MTEKLTTQMKWKNWKKRSSSKTGVERLKRLKVGQLKRTHKFKRLKFGTVGNFQNVRKVRAAENVHKAGDCTRVHKARKAEKIGNVFKIKKRVDIIENAVLKMTAGPST